MRVEIKHDDGSVEEHDGKDVIIHHLNKRRTDVFALEEVMRALSHCTKMEAQRVLAFVSDVMERRSV